MRTKLALLGLLILICCFASPVFAQTTGGAPVPDSGIKWIGIGIGMGLASGLCGIGQGNATAGAAQAIARNPGATAAIRFSLILGLVLIESLAIYTLVIVFGK